jgi:hypothetical protein
LEYAPHEVDLPDVQSSPFLSGGEGADAAIDCVGGQLIGDIVSALRPGGAIMSFGSLAGQNEKLQVGRCSPWGSQLCHLRLWAPQTVCGLTPDRSAVSFWLWRGEQAAEGK